VTEVETWFIKDILEAILYARYGARFPLDNISAHWELELKKKHSLCGRILFCDGRYTNINWVGLWVMIAMLVIIYTTRYIVEMIHGLVIKVCNTITDATSKLVTLSKSATKSMQLVGSSIKQVMVCFTDEVVATWRSFSFFNLTERIGRADQSSWRFGSSAASAARLHQNILSDTRHNENYSL
jgi:hypothetical protein